VEFYFPDLAMNDETELDFDSDEEAVSDDDEEDDDGEEGLNRDPRMSKFTLDEMNRMKELKDRKWTFDSIQKQFRRLSSPAELQRYVKYAASGGTKYMRFKVSVVRAAFTRIPNQLHI